MVTETTNLPLCVDLDRALLATNPLHESILDAARSNPRALCWLPGVIARGPDAIIARLAENATLDVDYWPLREDMVQFMREQAAAGRKVVLVTSLCRQITDALAKRIDCPVDVVAPDGKGDIRAASRAERLSLLFPGGFIYAGSCKTDLVVWQGSSESILVDATGDVARRARQIREPLRASSGCSGSLDTLFRSLRLHQWAKNALIFVPLILGGKASDPGAWMMGLLGFLALGLAASATYLVNDLWDLPSDRRHWSKRSRPLASGELSIGAGVLLALAGILSAFALGAWLGPAVLAVLSLYVAVTLSYSFVLKRVPILDVFLLASLFTIRLGLGIALTDVRLSPWLLVFSMFVFMSLSMAKRHTEVQRMIDHGQNTMHGRGYVAADAPLTLGCGLASMFSAVLILILYLIEDAFPRGLYARPDFLWMAPAILFLFLGRIWLLCQRGQLNDDPVAFALKDKVSLALGAIMALTVAFAVLGLGLG